MLLDGITVVKINGLLSRLLQNLIVDKLIPSFLSSRRFPSLALFLYHQKLQEKDKELK